ncbi:MAG: carbohydrate-binding protein, partial [Bacteroidota bacterium]|nr:carbohydrate-binding protein [Bacteroidota bacterium]
TLHRFMGWKTILDEGGAWIQYNTVRFANKAARSVSIRASSPTGATLVIRTTAASDPPIAEIRIPKTTDWRTTKQTVAHLPAGTKNLVVELKGEGRVEFDWIRFE